MSFLYTDFEDIVDYEMGEAPPEAFTNFKALVIQERAIANLCTTYLTESDLGTRESGLRVPEEIIQTVWDPNTFTPWTYTLALYLLQRCRASSRFDLTGLADILKEHAFYATLYIAADLFNEDDDLYVPDVVFTRLGFPCPRERQSGREVCKAHIAELERVRVFQETLQLQKVSDVTRECGERDSERTSTTEDIIIAPDVTSGMSAKEYMGCDEGIVCTRGMLHLKEYILARVFRWDVNFHTAKERPMLFDFVKRMEMVFGRPVYGRT
jgi:hypothetical protein